MKNVLKSKAVKHAPIFKTDKLIEIYEKRDGVPITYVCTTDLLASDMPVDIFYRATPHPKFGNRYFGVYKNPFANDAQIMITNADAIESSDRYSFAVIEDKDGGLWYSQSHHDCLMIDGSMIDGGREYVRGSNIKGIFRVVDGEFSQVEEVDNVPDEWPGQDSGAEDFTNF